MFGGHDSMRDTEEATGPHDDPASSRTDGVVVFFVASCAITWLLALPAASAWARHEQPAPHALALAGLSAFGPTLAAVAVAAPRRELGSVFGRWRTHPIWIVLALLTPMALQLIAKAIEVALGGEPSAWVYLPARPEHVAALFVFSIGEEFGWRGFAHPRLVARHGPVVGPFILGTVWIVWHAMFLINPQTGALDLAGNLMLLSLPFYSIVYAWFYQRSGGSIAVAIALHAGGHLDNSTRIPESEVRLRMITLAVVIVASIVAARSMLARSREVRAH
jgi:membrane protease YdiL (CAAX protease family)